MNPTIATAFPNTSLGNQLLQVARLISLRNTLNLKRQIFFCSLGGFDTHTNETGQNPTNPNGGGGNLGSQGGLLTQMRQGMGAFYVEMVGPGVSDSVATRERS